MKPINGIISGDLTIEESAEITGEVTGDVYLEEGELLLTGTVKGTIYLSEGTSLEVIGDCEDIDADAANVAVMGNVYGNITLRDAYLEVNDNGIVHGEVIDELDEDGVTYYDDYDDDYEDEEDDDEDDDDDDDEDDDDEFDDDEFDDGDNY